MTTRDTSVMLARNPGDTPGFEAIVCGPMYLPWAQIPGCTCSLQLIMLLLAIGCVGTLICMMLQFNTVAHSPHTLMFECTLYGLLNC